MRKCRWKENNSSLIYHDGFFHGFFNYEDEDGAGPMAVIEKTDGTCESIPIEWVRFVNPPKSDTEDRPDKTQQTHTAIGRLGTLYLSMHNTNRHSIAAVNHFAKWADQRTTLHSPVECKPLK